jgi:hypothetical protein
MDPHSDPIKMVVPQQFRQPHGNWQKHSPPILWLALVGFSERVFSVMGVNLNVGGVPANVKSYGGRG